MTLNSPLLRNLSILKGDNTHILLFTLDQKLRKTTENSEVNEQLKRRSESIMECVDRFATKKPWIKCNKFNGWITNKIKNDLKSCDELFHLKMKHPRESNSTMHKKIAIESRKRVNRRRKKLTTKNPCEFDR